MSALSGWKSANCTRSTASANRSFSYIANNYVKQLLITSYLSIIFSLLEKYHKKGMFFLKIGTAFG